MLNQKLWTALITPFLISGRVDHEALRCLLDRQEDEGNGVLLLGSTGENVLLEESERFEVIRKISDHPVRTPLMVGVTAASLSSALNWISFCKDYPVSAFLISAPMYTRPGIKGQIRWFETLLNYADRPVMLYNIPQRTGVPIYKEVVEKLAGHKNFWAFKESGVHPENVFYYSQLGIKVFCGNDLDLVEMIQSGARGLVSVISNIWPSFVLGILEEHLMGGLKSQDKDIWEKVCFPFTLAPNPIPLKILMQRLGLIKCGYVRPPLSLGDLNSLEPLLNANKLVLEFNNGSVFSTLCNARPI